MRIATNAQRPAQESFQLMVNTPPQERPAPAPAVASSSAPQPPPPTSQTYDYAGDDHNTFFETDTFNDPRTSDNVLRRGSLLPAATAAAALASLHNHRAEYDWDSDPVCALFFQIEIGRHLLTSLCLIGCNIRSRFKRLQASRAIRTHDHGTAFGRGGAVLYHHFYPARAAAFVPCTFSARAILDTTARISAYETKSTS